MKAFLSCFRLVGGAVALLVVAASAHAEGNRLLPFWGQPYPYGYAWTVTPPVPVEADRCRQRRRVDGTRARRRGGPRPCEVVLHARD